MREKNDTVSVVKSCLCLKEQDVGKTAVRLTLFSVTDQETLSFMNILCICNTTKFMSDTDPDSM